MREVIKNRFERIPVQVTRSEIEAMGVEIGLDDPLEAARVFDRLKGVSWRGDYVRSEEGWVAAWVKEVICFQQITLSASQQVSLQTRKPSLTG